VSARWQQWMARFEALSLRERVMVFVAVAAVVVFLGNQLAVEPQSAHGTLLKRQIADNKTQLGNLEIQVTAFQQAQANDPDLLNRERVKLAQRQLSELESKFAASQKGLVPADRMAGLLQDVLRQHKGLELVELRTLAPAPLVDRPAQKAAGADKPGETAATGGTAGSIETGNGGARNLYKHGFELTVRGSYTDFVLYLAHLEKLPARMYWGKVTMNADDYPRVLLTLTIYTLSLDKTWLEL
jgi:MSHA biogenesis protein MshJ